MTRTVRAQHRHSSRSRIIEAAMSLFERVGFEAATVEQIAAEVGISKRTIFRYFNTKMDIVLAPMLPGVRALPEAMAAAPLDLPIGAVVARGIKAVIRVLEQDRETVARHQRMARSTPMLRSMTRAMADGTAMEIRGEIAKRLDEPVTALPVAIWAEMIFVIAYGGRDAWLTQPEQSIAPVVAQGFAAAEQVIAELRPYGLDSL